MSVYCTAANFWGALPEKRCADDMADSGPVVLSLLYDTGRSGSGAEVRWEWGRALDGGTPRTGGGDLTGDVGRKGDSPRLFHIHVAANVAGRITERVVVVADRLAHASGPSHSLADPVANEAFADDEESETEKYEHAMAARGSMVIWSGDLIRLERR